MFIYVNISSVPGLSRAGKIFFIKIVTYLLFKKIGKTRKNGKKQVSGT